MPAVPPLVVPPELADDLVRLRPFVAADAPAVYQACRDPSIRRFTTFPEPRDEREVEAWIEAHPSLRLLGESLDLAIVPIGEQTAVGAVGLGHLEYADRRGEIGYWLAPDARGRGLATAAVRLLSAWALSPPLELLRLGLHADVENSASRRTAERAGYAYEGVLRSYLYAKGRRWDVAAYSRIA